MKCLEIRLRIRSEKLERRYWVRINRTVIESSEEDDWKRRKRSSCWRPEQLFPSSETEHLLYIHPPRDLPTGRHAR